MQTTCACPHCGQETNHLVRSDDYAMFAWCQVCYRVHVVEAARPFRLHFDAGRLPDGREPSPALSRG